MLHMLPENCSPLLSSSVVCVHFHMCDYICVLALYVITTPFVRLSFLLSAVISTLLSRPVHYQPFCWITSPVLLAETHTDTNTHSAQVSCHVNDKSAGQELTGWRQVCVRLCCEALIVMLVDLSRSSPSCCDGTSLRLHQSTNNSQTKTPINIYTVNCV